MRKQSFFRSVAIVVLAGLSLAGCAEWIEWNQKLTVTVEVDGKLISGSSVSYVAWTAESGAAGHYATNYSGEATVIELGERGVLFALLGGATKQIAARTYKVRTPDFKDLTLRSVRERMRSSREVLEVPRELYPIFVAFSDINDPMSVKKVDPEDLAASFGNGVRLVGISVQITQEQITDGAVETVMNWLGALKGGYLHGGTTSRGSPLRLHGGNFKKG